MNETNTKIKEYLSNFLTSAQCTRYFECKAGILKNKKKQLNLCHSLFQHYRNAK